MVIALNRESSDRFHCEKCDYKCFKPNDWQRHLETKKHIGDVLEPRFPRFPRPNNCQYCGKIYGSRNGLWYHNKKCSQNQNKIIETLITQNEEFKNMIIDQNKIILEMASKNSNHQTNCTNNNNNNNNSNNTNNNSFNIQLFLNVDCKDAMNITEFVDSIKLQIQQLEAIGKLGFVNGMSNILIDSLNEIEVTKRPIHCSDVKRETIYIKDNNVWAKEDETNSKLKDAIKKVAHKNVKQISKWQLEHPDHLTSESKDNETFLKIVKHSTNASTDEESNKNINKIVSKVAKEVVIHKEKDKN
jgi:hypothetical protein